jgi:alpha-mannosidase
MNNYQNTNYHYQQRGAAVWRYRISTHSPSSPPSLSGRSGKELSHPLQSVGVKGGVTPRLPDVGSIIQVSPSSVTLVTLKRAEDGNGLIARLHQSTGESVTATLRSPLKPIKSAAVTDIVEKNDEPTEIKNGAVELSMPPFSIRTVRLEF